EWIAHRRRSAPRQDVSPSGEGIRSPEETSMRSPARPVCIAAAIAALIAGCNDGNDANHITEPTGPLPAVASQHASPSAGTVVHVADVEQLYAAVNDTANAGTTLLLAPGTYGLSATDRSD